MIRPMPILKIIINSLSFIKIPFLFYSLFILFHSILITNFSFIPNLLNQIKSIIKLFMSRVRQFSAQRNDLTKSRLAQSRNSQSSHLKSNKIQKYQIATPVSNKRVETPKANLSSSRVSQKSSKSEYICTGCFNTKLASDRKEQRRNELLREKQIERSNNRAMLNDDHQRYLKQSRMQNQAQQMNYYNRKTIEEKRNQKIKQQEQKSKFNQQEREQYQRYLNEVKTKQEQRQKFNQKYRKDLQSQIQLRQKNMLQSKFHQLNQSAYNFLSKSQEIYLTEKAQKQHEYREQLLKQIQSRQQQLKRTQQQKNTVQNIGIGITEAAYLREIQRQKINNQRQQTLLEEANKRKKMREAELHREKLHQQKLNEERQQQEKQKQLMQKEFQIKKQKQTLTYLGQLKNQIDLQKRKKEHQRNFIHEPTNTSIQILEKPDERKSCKSCDKNFSKTFLTRVK